MFTLSMNLFAAAAAAALLCVVANLVLSLHKSKTASCTDNRAKNSKLELLGLLAVVAACHHHHRRCRRPQIAKHKSTEKRNVS